MINFIIVEDNASHMRKTKKIVIDYMMKNSVVFDILEFNKIDEKFDKVINNSDKNNIYILDFELEDTNAIEVSRMIRKTDWKSPIIIFSVNGGMAYETFKQRLQILDFVNKQYEAEKNLHELFDICLEQLKYKNNFSVMVGKKAYTIDVDKILYFYKDSIERKSIVVTDNDEYKIPLNLYEVKELLNDDFKYTHRSYIVNTKRVSIYDWKTNEVTFDNGKKVHALSKTHKKEIIKS